MPNNLQLTAAVPVSNIRMIKVLRVTDLDEDNKSLTVDLIISNAGGGVVFEPLPWRMQISNTSCNAILINPAPATTASTLVLGTLSAVGAFDAVYSAYIGAGNAGDRRGALLNALKAVSGVVVGSSASALNGTTQSALPAGTVS